MTEVDTPPSFKVVVPITLPTSTVLTNCPSGIAVTGDLTTVPLCRIPFNSLGVTVNTERELDTSTSKCPLEKGDSRKKRGQIYLSHPNPAQSASFRVGKINPLFGLHEETGTDGSVGRVGSADHSAREKRDMWALGLDVRPANGCPLFPFCHQRSQKGSSSLASVSYSPSGLDLSIIDKGMSDGIILTT